MAIPNKQIGWSQESNLLWNISSQLDRLTKVIANLSPGGGGTNIYNSDGTLTGNRTLNGANNDLTFSDLNVFKTTSGGNDLGLKLDFANSVYEFGQITGGNITKFIISDAGREIYTSINNSINGLLISQSNDNYKFGVFNGGNVTNITISDGAVYPIQFNGTNLSSGTAGANSGQHLKVRINGVNYKIALLNP